MKRILSILMILVLALGLCSCSLPRKLFSRLNGAQKNPAAENSTVEEQQDPTTEAPVTIELSSYTAKIAVGETVALTARAETEQPLKWKSSNEAVALVNSQGIVTGASAGVANITCYLDENIQAACTVTVTAPMEEAEPEQPPVETGSDQLFPESSTAYLTAEQILARLSALTCATPTGNYAQDAVNEIYARNGYVFNNSTIQAFYQGKAWYTPNAAFSDAHLNTFERANIELLQQYK